MIQFKYIKQKKKILWIAHRQLLLDQAAESFQKFAYAENMPHISEFTYRIVSGATWHDRTIDINKKDNILILSKDSIGRNLERLDDWLKNEDEIYLIIDEAHHSTAKTYRKIIDYVNSKVKNVKLIGLTATPFRTSESEAGLLAKIYKDGVKEDDSIVKNDLGITYQIIVNTYVKNKKEYGKTIVFAVNVNHAIALNELFKKADVLSDFIVSDIRDMVTGVTISREENEEKLQAYRDGDLEVLINVNILTEGIDLPQTKTVFLARPTVSKILMTQMVGRALRGTAADGTAEAYIVSFVDKWNENIAWCNPDTIFGGDGKFTENDVEYEKRQISMIAISKIEEFASLLDDTIDTTKLEKVPFIQRVPIGMYAFTYLEKSGMDLSYQVMVYDSTKTAYEQLMEGLPELFVSYGIENEYLSDELLSELEKQCSETYFCGEMIPPYESRDIIHILKYYAQYEEVPSFYTFEEVDMKKLDISKIAKYIVDEDMGPSKKSEYVEGIWEDNDDNILRLFFGKKIYFMKQLDIEILKITNPELFKEKDNVVYGKRSYEDMSLAEIRRVNPNLEKEIRDSVFKKSRNSEGEYECACCKMTSRNRIPFQVDHIVPLNKGGKTVVENLQILCRVCNGTKGDK